MKYNYLFDGRKISRLGFGLYKGENSKKGDDLMLKNIIFGLSRGINVIDTAQRYRNGRSEKVIRKLLEIYKKRENLILITKAGLIPDYVKKKKILKKLKIKKSNCLLENDFCIDPKYISWSVDNSLKKMNTQYIDFYLLHNPELSLMLKGGHKKIISALKVLEEKKRQKKIRNYGISTWSGFRRLSNNKFQLNIKKIVDDLKKEIGKDHGFKCLEAPISIGMPDLLNYKPLKNFKLGYFLKKNDINFFSSASLYEGNLEKLVELNKIFNSTNINKDMSNEINKANVSFPLSENSLRRLFILLENFKRNKIFLTNKKLNFSKIKNINGINISFLKSLPFITTSLIGMDKKSYITSNLKEFMHKIDDKKINNINEICCLQMQKK